MTTAIRSPGDVPLWQEEVDVLVVGGGSAGTIAAIQAGRTGAKTMVMERASYLGGMTTRGGRTMYCTRCLIRAC